MLKQIDMDKLVSNPDAPSRMSGIMGKKLGRSIQAIGHYKAIVVRPLGSEQYQILDGHARVESLRSMGQKKVLCDIWDIDDNTARLFLAACSSVKGVPVPELRIGLLFDLLERFTPAELGCILPEGEAHLSRLLAFEAGEDGDDWDSAEEAVPSEIPNENVPSTPKEPYDVTMTLRMTKTQYAAIRTLLHKYMRKAKIQDMGEALAQYLLEKQDERESRSIKRAVSFPHPG